MVSGVDAFDVALVGLDLDGVGLVLVGVHLDLLDGIGGMGEGGRCEEKKGGDEGFLQARGHGFLR